MRIVIDCDPGNGVPGANVDDGLALALAVAAHPELTLEAITTVSGNTSSALGFASAQTLIENLGTEVPIYLGAERALVEPPERWRTHLDREDADATVAGTWGSTPRPRAAHDVPRTPAAQVLGELVRAHPGAITIVAIGPLTNLALATRLFPDFARNVARIIIMGGVFEVDGYPVDTNFGVDPDAAAIVLSSGAQITLVPMDATTTTLMTHPDLDRIEQLDTRLTRALVPTLRPWITYSARTRGIGGMWIHDVVTVALLLDPGIVETRNLAISVDLLPGTTRGRTVRWAPDALPALGAAPAPIEVVTGIDNARLLDLLTDTLAAHG
ncbi:nucleoside hydrolase [Mycetocola sp. JXN-3]|uniref:nucleoside hydrolase n=1 Tax=Mycetocola sp. JXN-3 TaxID=2116510 RepID=UPI00165D05EB|nr:nucleoside hydrolase [Mycetocola sp. JXN-3]